MIVSAQLYVFESRLRKRWKRKFNGAVSNTITMPNGISVLYVLLGYGALPGYTEFLFDSFDRAVYGCVKKRRTVSKFDYGYMR